MESWRVDLRVGMAEGCNFNSQRGFSEENAPAHWEIGRNRSPWGDAKAILHDQRDRVVILHADGGGHPEFR
jgi:hypothetical protein